MVKKKVENCTSSETDISFKSRSKYLKSTFVSVAENFAQDEPERGLTKCCIKLSIFHMSLTLPLRCFTNCARTPRAASSRFFATTYSVVFLLTVSSETSRAWLP